MKSCRLKFTEGSWNSMGSLREKDSLLLNGRKGAVEVGEPACSIKKDRPARAVLKVDVRILEAKKCRCCGDEVKEKTRRNGGLEKGRPLLWSILK